jgi:hypothetical protein
MKRPDFILTAAWLVLSFAGLLLAIGLVLIR